MSSVLAPESELNPLLYLAQLVANESQLFTHAQSPFRASVYEGTGNILVVTGENASGKSIFFQSMAYRAKTQLNALGIQISIRERTGAGTYEGSGFRRALMFGDESEQSTGATSVGVVASGFRNAISYATDDKRNVLMLDEPELGLSAGYSRAMGEYLAQQAATLPDKALGVVVVTHSRDLVWGIIAGGGGSTPNFVNLDPKPQNLGEWLTNSENRTIAELLNLQKIGHERAAQVRALLRDKPAKPAK